MSCRANRKNGCFLWRKLDAGAVLGEGSKQAVEFDNMPDISARFPRPHRSSVTPDLDRGWRSRLGAVEQPITRSHCRSSRTVILADTEIHKIGGLEVPIYSETRSIADAVRNPKLVNLSAAIEAMKSAISEPQAIPDALAWAARTYRSARIIESCLEAVTSNG